MSKKIKVDKLTEFAKRLEKIYGLDISSASQQTQGGGPRDIGREELQAMVDIFLGENYDRKKFEQIAGLKKTMGQQQVVLWKCLDTAMITREQYLDLFFALLKAIFRETKKVMGARDYQKLFGKSSTHAGLINKEVLLIDREVFLKCEYECEK